MTSQDLFKARIVWSYLLDLDNAPLLNWQAWAEETILKIDFIAPFWLCELTAAPSAQAALVCVRDGIWLESEEYRTDEIDEEAILFGLLYLRFAHNEECAKEAWRVMADFGDPVNYVESGRWRQYQRDRKVDISGMSLKQARRSSFVLLQHMLYGLFVKFLAGHRTSRSLCIFERIHVNDCFGRERPVVPSCCLS